MNSLEMKIGQVARRAGVSVDTVRYYERLGLLTSLGRTSSGYRRFDGIAAERIRFAKELQDLGFTLDEIREVLEDVDRGSAACASERVRFEALLGRLEERMAKLAATRSRIEGLLSRCDAGACDWTDRASAVAARQ
jgi:DNA-binding transcriptional MerR regulator